ncbi:hypothetical protein [Cohnella boryungensis]|uniref:Uncharacterized protein n=1 Tax=Cohnella boryungensis TaxID=768479 RepID=A0ABV8SBP8_9BACL
MKNNLYPYERNWRQQDHEIETSDCRFARGRQRLPGHRQSRGSIL